MELNFSAKRNKPMERICMFHPAEYLIKKVKYN